MTGDKIRMYSVDKEAYKQYYGDNFNIESLFKQVVDIVVTDDSKVYYTKEGDNFISVNSSQKLDQTKTYFEYVGGNENYARELIISPVEGLRLKAGNQDRFWIDDDGNLSLAGVIFAGGGRIGGF
jgi:hypothetical protein